MWFFSGPLDDSDYNRQLFHDQKREKIIEFSIEIFIIFIMIFIFIIAIRLYF
jgi:hypothetical protein